MINLQTETDHLADILSHSEHEVDLRRGVRRDVARVLANRSGLLSHADRVLVHAVFERGTTLAELAALSGQNPRALGRRLRVLLRRVQSPEFVYVMERTGEFLPDASAAADVSSAPLALRRIAKECVLEGKPLRALAREMGVTYHALRRKLQDLRATAIAAQRDRRRAKLAAAAAKAAATRVSAPPPPAHGRLPSLARVAAVRGGAR